MQKEGNPGTISQRTTDSGFGQANWEKELGKLEEREQTAMGASTGVGSERFKKL